MRDCCRRIAEYRATGGAEWPSNPLVMRNIVMHAYENLNPQLIREMAENDVPELLTHCLFLLGGEAG
jgi:uncharacterized protein with HEPN domain